MATRFIVPFPQRSESNSQRVTDAGLWLYQGLGQGDFTDQQRTPTMRTGSVIEVLNHNDEVAKKRYWICVPRRALTSSFVKSPEVKKEEAVEHPGIR